MAGTDSITIYRGEDAELNFAMNPVEDISGWTLEFTLEGSSSKLIQKAATITDGPNGAFQVVLTDDETNVPVGIYQYDVWRTDADSARVLAVGSFTVSDVARLPSSY